MRKKCHSLRRHIKRGCLRGEQYQDGRDNVEYSEAKRELKQAIIRSKKGQHLCKQVDPWGLPYGLVTKKLIGQRLIPRINLPSWLENIVDTLFPKNAVIKCPPAEDGYEFPEITEGKIIHQAKKISSEKAPGPIGVTDLVVKGIALSRPDILCKMFDMCFDVGNYPSVWKKAKLVLLPKGK